MGTRKVKSEPEVPCATLYLDDLEEIATNLKLSAQNPEEAQIRFVISDREFDSTDDLKVRGGSTSSIEIRLVGPGSYAAVRISRFDAYVHCDGRYADIFDVFKRNARWWGNSVRSMPAWLKGTFWAYLFVWSAAMEATAKHPTAQWVLAAISAAILLGAVAAYVRHSSIRLRYSHEGGAKGWFQRHGQQLFIAILAAIVGAVIKSVIDRLLK